MRIVSENTETEIARHQAEIARDRAMNEASWALRELTANLLRVTRGAGKPYEIVRQAQALIEAMIDYRDAAGYFPSSDELADALSAERDPEFLERLSDENLAEYYAK